ncbi:MAG: TRAP transporter small permease [Desulfobulbaceae bacterium]|uniref:TRAP transporter small permease n=1 Tax=Candidatus Desulfobia pelagia TaxID=2841692 RepID=A0A8J6TD27_9BACT|nr:TRAP transporter small permease [Candidatus Desulfobia pelagia]
MNRIVAVLEDGFLCMLLIVMVFLASLQIMLRQFFSGGFLWAEPLLRYLVLWAGIMGAVVATRKGKHIAMDVASYLVPGKIQPWLHLIVHLFSTGVGAVLFWAAVIFVRNEAILGGQELLGIPSWVWNMIFPTGFFLISFHFAAALLQDVVKLSGRSPHRNNFES